MPDHEMPKDIDEFVQKWDEATRDLVDKFIDHFPVLNSHEVYEIVLESIALGVAINEDAAKRAASHVIHSKGENN